MSRTDPAGFTANVVTTAANKGVLLALVAMAQTMVVITGGTDLSVGMVLVLANCLASYVVAGSLATALPGVLFVLLAGPARGATNGLVVVYGRLQPIVTTIATSALFFGLHRLRRQPGSSDDFNLDLADSLTGQLAGGVPASLVLLLVVVLLVWLPFSLADRPGRLRHGSAEAAAFMSGVPIRKAKFVAYAPGLLAAIGGLFLTCFTYAWARPRPPTAIPTLCSLIAAVVLGGVSLFGGTGSAIGAIFGALSPFAPSATSCSSSTSTCSGSPCSRAASCCSPSAWACSG
ncbi:MAG: ABC transporter permease [Geminicoccaceae bacterium]